MIHLIQPQKQKEYVHSRHVLRPAPRDQEVAGAPAREGRGAGGGSESLLNTVISTTRGAAECCENPMPATLAWNWNWEEVEAAVFNPAWAQALSSPTAVDTRCKQVVVFCKE